jgi:hypothetical protein
MRPRFAFAARVMNRRVSGVRGLLGPRRARHWHDVATPGRLGSAGPYMDGPRVLSVYTTALRARPGACAVIASVSAAAIGDAFAQLTSYTVARAGWTYRDSFAKDAYWMCRDSTVPDPYFGSDLSLARLATFTTIVGSLVGIGGEFWYRQLLRKFPGWTYEVVLRTILDKVRTTVVTR